MFDNQAFGHFGAPDMLGAEYGAPESTQYSGQTMYGAEEPQQTSEPTPYIRNGKSLPNLKGGATDEMVKADRGIIGLVSEIQRRMGLAQTGVIKTSDIKDYQMKSGLTADGVIGPQTYTKLGFKEPFSGSQRTHQVAPKQDAQPPAPIARPWYKNPWVWGGSTIVVAGLAYALWPKGDDNA